jgi:Disulfide bond formation protein DsbB|tara:strand:- start:27 stop:506 length:480 start_codon:yes stop_codon:yes gene_type:complete
MSDIFEIKKFYIIVFIISLLSLLIALYIEFFLGYPPCKLCIYQRIPYLVSIFITFLGISYSKNLIWLYVLLITFFSSFLLSGYHFGIEKEIFNEFSGCTGNSLNIIDKNELLKLLNSEINSCKNVDFRIFGLSLATINLLLSFVIFILIIKVIKNEKNK